MPIFRHTTTPARSCKCKNEKAARTAKAQTAFLFTFSYTRTISRVISARECAPHICMVSASSPASLSM